jgi:methyltransferase-like protein
MKTRKQTNQTQPYTLVFLRILDIIKFYHWNTKDYSKHRATDKLHEALGKLVDSYVEQRFGEKGRVVVHETVRYDTLTDDAFLKEIGQFKEYLIHMQNPSTDLSNKRDEMLGEVNQFLYLWTLQ